MKTPTTKLEQALRKLTNRRHGKAAVAKLNSKLTVEQAEGYVERRQAAAEARKIARRKGELRDPAIKVRKMRTFIV